jgi:phosphohistidine phosphatase SixA
VLPIEPSGDRYRLISSDEARRRGFVYLANWLEKVEKEWEKRRGAKAKSMSIYERLDQYRGLSKQNPQARYLVLYPNFQRVMLSTVIRRDEIEFEINEQRLKINNFIVESALYYYETEDEMEAYYLCTCLNSSTVDKKIQNFRRRQQKTRPNIHKKIFDIVNIPRFDPSNDIHRRLAELGELCSQKVAEWLKSRGQGKIKSIGVLRSRVREMLKDELKEIDGLVQKIL